MFFTLFLPDLAVIPILVTGGAAVLPAILAAVASFIALLFKPRELLRFCRARPLVPFSILVGIVGLWFAIPALMAWMQPAPVSARVTAPTGVAPAGTAGTDWSKVALEIIASRQRGTQPATSRPTPKTSDTTDATPRTGLPLIFRQNSSRTGGSGPAPTGLQELWLHRIDNSMTLSSPLVHAGRVYSAFTILDPPGSYGGVVCLDAANGRVIWMQETRDAAGTEDMQGFFSSPALSADGTRLVIGQGLHYDTQAKLLCLDTATGKILWTVPTELHVESSPAIEGDMVVVGAGAVEDANTRRPTGHPGYVFAVRLSTGEELWRYDLADPESSPAIDQGIAYIGSGFNGQAVAALRIGPTEANRLVWRTATPHPATGPVTLTDQLVLIGVGNGDFVFADPKPEGFVIAFDKTTGKEVWKSKQPDAVLGPIAVRDGLAIAPVRNGELVALSTTDGSEKWRTRLSKSPVLAGPAFPGALIYVSSAEGYLHVVDPKDGSVIEKIYLNDPARPGELGLTMSSPWVSEGRIYVGSETGGLKALTGSATR